MSMFAVTLLAALAVLAEPPPEGIEAAFASFADHCGRDDGALWGVSLCGAVLIADFERGRLYASEPDPSATLAAVGDAFAGPLPASLPRANTGVDWQGRRWTQVLWPLPDDHAERMRLLLHESFHRIQPRLGLAGEENKNAHLDESAGRLWMRLEWRALARALTEPDWRAAFEDALAFRRHRYRLIESARAGERALELNEGLAEYTGVRLAYSGDAAAERAAATLSEADGWEHLARRFAYASGPAWGLLLDRVSPDWRSRVLAGADLTELGVRALELPARGEASLRERALVYGLDQIEAQESDRARAREAERERLRDLLLDPEALVLPLTEAQMSFDPRTVATLPPEGTIYRGLTLTDRWGRIEVDGPALISTDFSTLRVSPVIRNAPSQLSGVDWQLVLESGWQYRGGRLLAPGGEP